MEHAHVESCRAIVIMIKDNQAIERVISTIARMKVKAPVFVRTQYILPLRDVFVSFFFVSLGMFFDFQLLTEKPVEVGLLLLAFIGGKGLITILAASSFPVRHG